MTAAVTALAVAASFLPVDLAGMEVGYATRAKQRILATDDWQRTEWPEVTRVAEDPIERWRPLVAKWFHWEDVDRALCLMHYESRGNPNAKNPDSTATGLLQVMHSVWAETFGVTDRDEWTDPELNIYAASRIKAIQGWTAWAPYNRGLCRDA